MTGKHRTLYLLALAAAALSYILADRREPLVLLCVLIAVPAATFALQILAMKDLEISWKAAGDCRSGQSAPVKISVSRRRRLPFGALRVRLAFENVLFGEVREEDLCLPLEERKELEFSCAYRARDCGEIRVTAREILCYDLLGLFCWRYPSDHSESFLVYPPELRLSIEVSRRPATRNFGELYDPGRKGQDVSEVSGLRDYVSGDPLHSIHWKLSGKLDRLIVREFGYPANYSTLVLRETMKSSEGMEIPHSCLNAVLGLAASLSYGMMQKSLEHDTGYNEKGTIQTVPVNSIAAHERMVLHMLNTPLPEEGRSQDTVQSFLHRNIHDIYTKVIYITPVYDEQAIRELSRNVDLTVIHVMEKREAAYAAAGGFLLIPVSAEDYQNTLHNVVI